MFDEGAQIFMSNPNGFNAKKNTYSGIKYDKQLTSLPEKILEYTRLERIKAIHAETYQFMSQKLEEARIGEASKLSKIRTIDKAIPNQIPANGSANISISLNDESNETWRVFWISQESNGLVLNFVSKCPIGGCLN